MLSRIEWLFARLILAALVATTGCGDSGGGGPVEPPQCSGQQVLCGGSCVSTQTDAANCGTCGNACGAGFTCSAGQCQPPPAACGAGENRCNGACVNLQTSASNCGNCGTVCGAGLTCSAGVCTPVVMAVCGDSQLTGSEACDDGNTQPNDGCGSSCQAESGWRCESAPSRCYRQEIEPNDTAANATTVQPLSSVWIRGASTPSGDVDVYQITLPAVADLRITTFDGSYAGTAPGTCANGIDTLLELRNEAGTVLESDDDSGVDFCSAISEVDTGAQRLPAGKYFISVKSLDGSAIPAYTLLVEVTALCGNGRIQGPELCDDANLTSGDGCSSACTLEKPAEVEPNDTPAAANSVPAPFLMGGALSSGTDADVFRFTLPATADLELETFDGSFSGSNARTCASIDTKLELLDSTGAILTSDDDSGVGFCSALKPGTDRVMRRLPAGTYFARVLPFDTAVTAYSLMAQVRALCGDGQVTGSEECDGGASCTATCERAPRCGDGLLDYPEYCDDGNRVSGDGCDNTCAAPQGLAAEVEPNNSIADANARATSSPSVRINATTRIVSTLSATDEDFYRMELASAQVVRLELFHNGLNRCDPGLAPELMVLNAQGSMIASDFDGGIRTCSALVLSLPAGTYYVWLGQPQLLDQVKYTLEVSFQASAGQEAEPNDTAATATAVSSTDGFIRGVIATSTDKDFFRITVPQGRPLSLRAEVIEGGAKSCELDEMDSVLELYDSTGALLTRDDSGGRGDCSRLDGTGSVPAHEEASSLAPGTYYLSVIPYSTTSTARHSFDYRLSIILR